MSTLSTGSAVLTAIRNYGVDTVFGIPGTHNLEFYRSLKDLGMRVVTTRHEQGAGYGSDGWSLQTGLPGVVITTSGPGLLNALSAAATSFCESRPMLILAPGPEQGAEFADKGTLHETKDQFSAAAAIVETAVRATSAHEAVEAVHAAFEGFATARPRPTYIEVPLDVLEQQVEADSLDLEACTHQRPGCTDDTLLEQARAALRGASRPVIVAGGGSRGAAEELREMVDTLGAPIVTTLNAKGVVDEHHPLALGANLRFTEVREYARTADVLLVVGSKLGEAELWVERLEATGTVVRIDLAEGQIDKNLTADIGLVGDAKATLRALLDGLESASPVTDFRADVAAALEAARAEGLETSRESTLIAEDIVAALPHDAIVSTDSSQICYLGLLNAIKVTTPNSTPYMATYATLGYGLPAALGARIGAPDRPTFAVVGDGALMFSLQELITVVEQGEDLTVIVVDNGGYGEIRANEISAGIDPVGVELTQPDWLLMAAASGGHGVAVDDLGQLKDAVANAVEAGGLQLIHIDAKRYTTAG